MTQPIRGWRLFVYLVLSIVLGAVLSALIWPDWIELGSERLPLADAAWGAFHVALLYLFLRAEMWRRDATLRSLLGPRPDARALRWTLVAVVAVVGCSLAAIYALFLPLSHVAPGLVEELLLDDSFVLVYTGGDHHLLATALSVVAGVAGVPLVEELLFRGLLLPAWAARWSVRRAVIGTAIAFAVFHVDPIGSFVFGVVTALAFLRTGGLWVPIIVHAGNNLVVYGGVLYDVVTGAPEMTLAEFRESWWVGLVALAIGAPLLVWVLKHLDDLAPAPAAAPQPSAVS